ncbi:MAG: hypothetical protein H7315_16295, partial [Herminiimonas sp.]|nr:hypothetical protein [Herminiimonas sp.]
MDDGHNGNTPFMPAIANQCDHAPSPDLGTLERMPKWLIIVPLTLQWLYLSLRFGGATVPSAANPAITAGGLVGEGKLEYFAQMGPLARGVTATSVGIRVDHAASDADRFESAMRAGGLTFPIIVKPDLGMCGYGVCRIDSPAALRAYAQAFPDGEVMVMQRYLPEEGEAGIFYVRDPRTGRGRITGLALRYFPRVVGDGRRTVLELMHADPRARRLIKQAAHQCVADPNFVPAAGQPVRLSTIGSTRVGGLYLNGGHLVTPALTAAIDAIARDMGEFHFGRFDVRFASTQALEQGKGFTIMEVNGAGSEAIEAWDPAIGILSGLRIVFAKQRLLFEIGAANR